MRPALLLALLSAACTTADGQRVPVLLQSTTVTCSEGTATLTLDQAEDLYLAELYDNTAKTTISVPAERNDTTVVFDCPDGASALVVRHASVLAERLSGNTEALDAPEDSDDDGGSGAPSPF